MKTKNRILALLITGTAALGFASSANAALIAYEGFDYPQQTGLASSANTGTGWTASWNSDSWRTNSSGFGEIGTGLTYSTLSTVGQAARNENNFNQSFRSFAPQAATGTYYISFLMQKDTTDANSFGVSLFNGASEQNFMGNANSGNFSVAGQGAVVSSTAITANATTFFVARYNMVSGIAHFWLDPSLSGTPTDASAFNGAGGTSFTAFAFDSVRLGKFGDGSGYLDEIRIGTTYADIAPIPEPSTVALLFGGLGALVLMRRRRAKA